MFKKMSLKGLTFQLFAITVLPLTALLLLITFSSNALHHQAMRSLVGSRDLRAAQASASAISELINQRGLLLEGLAAQAPALTPQQVVARASYLDRSFQGGVALFTPDGELLASNPEAYWSSTAVQVEIKEHLLHAEGGAVYASLPQDPGTGEPLLGAAVQTEDGSIAVGAFSPRELVTQALAGSFTGDQPSIAVVDSQRNHIITLGSPAEGEDLDEHPGLTAALSGQAGITFSKMGHDEHVVAYAPIQPLGWALLIEEPWQEIASPLLRTTQTAPLVLAPALVLALIALAFMARQIVQPLQTLAASAQELSRGRYQAIEQPVGGISEIRELQAELIRMSHRVQEAQNSLHGYIGAITQGQEEERRRLARELHDDTLQALIALNQRIQLARLSITKSEDAGALEELQSLAEQTIANLRRLTRALRPIYLEDLGLVASLEILAQESSRTLNIPINFQCMGENRRLAPEAELALYRMAQEALSNVARHSQANQASLSLSFGGRDVRMVVADDGAGFVVPESPAVFAREGHFGLLGLHERAELVGANFSIRSRPGEGTLLQVTLPQPSV